MIDLDLARRILDLAGGSIRYWAHDIIDVRETETIPKEGRTAGDILSLHLTDRDGRRHKVTIEEVAQRAAFSLANHEPDEDLADMVVQGLLYGDSRYYLPEVSEDERKALDEAMAGMRVEDDDV